MCANPVHVPYVSPANDPKAAKRMANAQVIACPRGHFDIYHIGAFDDAIAKQTEFLVQHLQRQMIFEHAGSNDC